MVRFYDPKDSTDLARAEALLKRGGVEYALVREPEKGIGPLQIHVAEEDVPMADQLVQQGR